MLKSFKKHGSAIDLKLFKLKERELMLTVTETNLMNDILVILQCFNSATVALQGSSYGTLYRVPFFYSEISRQLGDHRSINLGYVSADIMPKSLERLPARMPLTDWHYSAAILYPSMKYTVECVRTIGISNKLDILTSSFRKLGLQPVGQRSLRNVDRPGDDTSSEDEFDLQMIKYFEKMIERPDDTVPALLSLRDEFKLYLETQVHEKPSSFFKKNGETFPNLKIMADSIFNILMCILLR